MSPVVDPCDENIAPQPPLDASYWVIPGRFLAGPYPASRYFEYQTHRLLDSLLSAGITCFIDLTSPGDMPSYQKALLELSNWHGVQADYINEPIKDFDVPPQAQVVRILNAIDQALADGKAVYLHCQAGIGRTGTIAGCYLARHGLPGEQALQKLAELRRNAANARLASPETDAQRRLVQNWQSGQ